MNDASKSKRVTSIADMERDVANLNNQIVERQKVVDALKVDIEAMDNDPAYQRIVLLSYQRLKEIAIKRMAVPVREDTLLQHAEIVGQYNERLLLTEELASAKKVCVERETWIKNALRRVADLVAALRKDK